jgi:uncharacterized protein YbcC (UPF0753/DUF2309 family)
LFSSLPDWQTDVTGKVLEGIMQVYGLTQWINNHYFSTVDMRFFGGKKQHILVIWVVQEAAG